MGTRLDMNTIFHPQIDGQSKRTNQVLEYMLSACVIDFGAKWDQHLVLAEFDYNNSYYSNIQIAPFEVFMADGVDRLLNGLSSGGGEHGHGYVK